MFTVKNATNEERRNNRLDSARTAVRILNAVDHVDCVLAACLFYAKKPDGSPVLLFSDGSNFFSECEVVKAVHDLNDVVMHFPEMPDRPANGDPKPPEVKAPPGLAFPESER